jgi:hypothetical protein
MATFFYHRHLERSEGSPFQSQEMFRCAQHDSNTIMILKINPHPLQLLFSPVLYIFPSHPSHRPYLYI